MAELHVIGQITEVSGLKISSNQGVFCKWILQHGSSWKLEEGSEEGQTQVDSPEETEEVAVLCHPIDIHLSCRGIQGWPRLLLQVYHQDSYNRVDLCGYGIIHIPMKPGSHSLSCPTWRPFGTFCEELQRAFLGGGPQLVTTELIHSSSERSRIRTVPSATVHLELGVIFRNFENYGIMF